jgi:hypothetical protein
MVLTVISMRRRSASDISDGCENNNAFYNTAVDNDAGSFRHASSIIDLDGILEQRAGHDYEFLAELLSDLRREVHAQLQKVKDTISLLNQDDAISGNFGRMERAAQSIKDASFDMLCSNLHEVAAALEYQAKEKNLKGCMYEYEKMEHASNLLFEVLDSTELASST